MTPPPDSGDRDFVDAVISALPSGVLTLDLEGRITHTNRAAAVVFQRPRDDLMGRKLSDVRGELEAMLWPTERGEILLLPAARSGLLRLREPRVLGFSSRKLEDDAGTRIGTVVSFSDITDRKAEEKAEAHRQRLADIGAVVSSIAHEIRNPVFAIASLAQVLGAEEAVAADADLRQMAVKILEEARRISRLVEDLLAFGRERKLQRQRIDVVELVDTLVEDIRSSYSHMADEAVDVPVQLSLGPNLGEDRTWSLDPEAARQILSNLLRNAWHAVLARGRQRHAGQGIEVKLDRTARSLELRIVDRGVGIPADKLPRVFDAFFTTRRKGTGLGLAITDRLVRQHGGTISLESKAGEGTTVTLRFPP